MTTSEANGAPQLRTTWRNSAQHLSEQFARFIRLTILSAIPSLVNVISDNDHFDKKTLLAFILPFAEVAYRQVWPALDAKKATDLAVTDPAAEVPQTTDPGPTMAGPDGRR